MKSLRFLLLGATYVILLFGSSHGLAQQAGSGSPSNPEAKEDYGKQGSSSSSKVVKTNDEKTKKRRRKRLYPVLPFLPRMKDSQPTEPTGQKPIEPNKEKETTGNKKRIVAWPPPRHARARKSTTGHAENHRPGFGAVTGIENGLPAQPTQVWKSADIFNYEYGYINPYYPFPVDTPMPRPSAWDTHEGWVSKYLYDRPTVSPYMQLFRHDLSTYGSNLYNTLVRPDLGRSTGYGSHSLPQAPTFHGSPTMARPSKSDGKPSDTGHPSHFLNGVTNLDQVQH